MRSRYRAGEEGDRGPRPPQRQRPTNITKALVRLLYASRGFALKIIKQGIVSVNDKPARHVNAPVRLMQDEVRVDGQVLAHNPRGIYIAMNKPKKFAGAREPQSRHVMNLISKKSGWSIPLGPLAKSASGIIILTNDPDQRDVNNNVFALMDKEYYAKIKLPEKKISESTLKSIADTIESAYPENSEGVRVCIAQTNTRSLWLSITVRRAKYHEITKALHVAGLHVLAMERRRVGSISVESLPAGSWRRLSADEMQEIVTRSVQHEEIHERVTGEVATQEEEKSTWRNLYQRWFKST
jgi:pseudouridine synthase